MLKGDRLLWWLKTHRVAVLKGGWSTERSISLKTGAAVEAAFKRMGVPVQGVDVRPNLSSVLRKKRIDFCFNALHGPYGEDGQVQTLLEKLRIPYIGSGPRASALAMDKDLSKRRFAAARIPTAPWVVLQHPASPSSLKKVDRLLRRGPVFVKPVDQGSAVGVSRVDRKNQLSVALRSCFRVSKRTLVERFIAGRELTVGVLGNRALPVIEIIPEHTFYDFHSKYAPGGSRHICPADLTVPQQKIAQELSLRAHRSLGCQVVSRVDLILSISGRMQVLEVNTIPGMTNTSLLPEAAKQVGLGFDDLVLKIVELSLNARAKTR